MRMKMGRAYHQQEQALNLVVMVKQNTSEELKPLPFIARQELKDKIPKELPMVLWAIKMMLGEGPYTIYQATSDASCEYDEFELSCDEYDEIFNELMRPMRTTRCYDALPNIFNNS